MKLEFIFESEPVGFKRPVRSPFGHTYNPKKYEDFKKSLTEALMFHFSAVKETDHQHRYALSFKVFRSRDIGDLDNFLKPVKDALQASGIIWNDKQIIKYLEPFEMLIDKNNPRIWFRLIKIDTKGK